MGSTTFLACACRGQVEREFGEQFDGREAKPLSEVLDALQPAAEGVPAVVSGRIGVPDARSERNSRDGLDTGRNPVPVISNTPSSLTAPNRFFTARTIRWA